MPPPRPHELVVFLLCLREVDCPPRLADLASSEDWLCSCLCFEPIPSVAERSALFIKELSFHIRRQLMMLFSTGIGLERVGMDWSCRWAGPLALDAALPCKNK